MHPNFSQLTPRWFKRAFVYTGNIDDFRYRFEMDKDNGLLHTAVYTVYCFEVAKDVQQQDFPWDDQGVEQLKAWVDKEYEDGRVTMIAHSELLEKIQEFAPGRFPKE